MPEPGNVDDPGDCRPTRFPMPNTQNHDGQAPAAARMMTDALGQIGVPDDALHGPETQRALQNFQISGRPMPSAFIRALLLVKAAAAEANGALGVIPQPVAASITQAGLDLLAEDDPALMRHFAVDRFQTGSGTSTHMNANEVLATLATRALGQEVRAHDEVNAGQSSNDVIPSAIRVACVLETRRALHPALAHLQTVLDHKAREVWPHIKTGRTHLMDALPVRLGQALNAWSAQVRGAAQHMEAIQPALQRLPLGGTAVGTGVNAHPDFATRSCEALSRRAGLGFWPASNRMALIGAQDDLVALSGALRVLAIVLLKICNDLRWMNSGPLAGLGEITLEALQPGSSIMPGKVNPVVPEAVAMVAVQTIGHDAAIAMAAHGGSFELNTMLPLLAANLLESQSLLSQAAPWLADRAVATFKVRSERLQRSLASQPMLATALTPLVGHALALKIAQEASTTGRPVLDVAVELTPLPRSTLERVLDPARLTGAD